MPGTSLSFLQMVVVVVVIYLFTGIWYSSIFLLKTATSDVMALHLLKCTGMRDGVCDGAQL